jgi:hypothetical protein
MAQRGCTKSESRPAAPRSRSANSSSGNSRLEGTRPPDQPLKPSPRAPERGAETGEAAKLVGKPVDEPAELDVHAAREAERIRVHSAYGERRQHGVGGLCRARPIDEPSPFETEKHIAVRRQPGAFLLQRARTRIVELPARKRVEPRERQARRGHLLDRRREQFDREHHACRSQP